MSARSRSETTVALVMMLLGAFMAFQSFAFAAWQWRNPKANTVTFYSHYFDVLRFKKLEKFQ